MKNSFNGYYRPSEDDFLKIWNEGLIVLDTNVLLNLYRLPAEARNEFIEVLKSLKKRLWIPFQVGIEFQRRRITVIGNEHKNIESVLESTKKALSEIEIKVNSLELEKRNIKANPKALLKNLKDAGTELQRSIEKTQQSQLNISSEDELRDTLDELFKDKVGLPPKNQEELNGLIKDGEFRYENKIPPGFLDIEKENKASEANFIFDHLIYQRKYGDLILWRQILAHAKNENISTLILVTADRKEDWWWREMGKTVGPHFELSREINRESGVSLFWMYSPTEFIKHARQYFQANISEETVSEINKSAERPIADSFATEDYYDNDQIDSIINYRKHHQKESRAATKGLIKWIENNIGQVATANGDYELIALPRKNVKVAIQIIKFSRFNLNLAVYEMGLAIRKAKQNLHFKEYDFIKIIISIDMEDSDSNDNIEKAERLAQEYSEELSSEHRIEVIGGFTLPEDFHIVFTFDSKSGLINPIF